MPGECSLSPPCQLYNDHRRKRTRGKTWKVSHYQSRETNKKADNRQFIDRGKALPKFKIRRKRNERIKMTFIVDECKGGLRGWGEGR